MTLAAEQG